MSQDKINEFQPTRRRLLQGTGALGALSAVSLTAPVSMNAVAKGNDASQSQTLPLREYEFWDMTQMAELLHQGEVTPLELFDAAAARFEARSHLNLLAVSHLEQARSYATELSQAGKTAREQAFRSMPLRGVPFALKDLNIKMKGTVTTNGCLFFKDDVADYDSTLTQRYQAAGLNIMAKLTSPEFGQTATTESALHGDTLNPWDTSCSAGGSSGGSAAAVAARILPAVHASDGGGSIRIPASHCGIFGLKPSRGRIATGPDAMEGWMGLSVHNVVSRSVRDSAMLLELTQGPEPGTRVQHPNGAFLHAITTVPKGLKIAVMKHHPFGLPVHKDCIVGVDRTIALLESLGHHVETASPQLPIEAMYKGMGVTTSNGVLSTVQARERKLGRKAREDEFAPIVWGFMENAKKHTAQDVFAARTAYDQAGQSFDRFFQHYDLILAPVTAAPPPKIGELSLYQPFDDFVSGVIKASPITSMFNMTGLPAMSVPLHWNADGLPIGIQFGAAYGNEALLLALAAQLESAAPWQNRRPTMLG
ncbi:6-aminohexanoate-cyclic-dimer hydrolase [Shewanella sp. NFH-SH190041]|uniref:amidase n=1 Tax=Shewanella sp. NFH-SH190041 TaxID=2950245 RepID=UPI0021C435E3|nr:amidase [Shewanella sp. NFH-SH190041]BDM64299.1 6-aminohexanoate-cyclic-dimer hydrolase [Shewanella sp. NFH-SH190041]